VWWYGETTEAHVRTQEGGNAATYRPDELTTISYPSLLTAHGFSSILPHVFVVTVARVEGGSSTRRKRIEEWKRRIAKNVAATTSQAAIDQLR